MGLLARMEGGAEVDRVILARLRTTEAVDTRIDLIRILGDRRAASATPDLLEQARDEDPAVRVAALRSMRRIVGPEEVAPLIALVKSAPEGAERRAAISALVSACGDDDASGALVLGELKQASDAAQKDAWTRVLTAVGYPKALPTILEGLEDQDQDVVVTTVTRLSEWPDPAPIDAIFVLLESDPSSPIKRRAVSAVIQLTTTAAEHGQRPDDVLTGWFGRANAAVVTVEEKRQLLSGLARVHTLDSLLLVEPYLSDPEVKGEALYALLFIGSPLVRAGEHAAVKKVLPEETAIQDQELRWRFARLRGQIEAAEAPPQ
jgi:HEAT repeat protein